MRITCKRGILSLWDRQGKMRHSIKYTWPFEVRLNTRGVPSLFIAAPAKWWSELWYTWFRFDAVFTTRGHRWGMWVSAHGPRPVLKFAWAWRGVNRVVSIGPVAGTWVRTYALPLA